MPRTGVRHKESEAKETSAVNGNNFFLPQETCLTASTVDDEEFELS